MIDPNPSPENPQKKDAPSPQAIPMHILVDGKTIAEVYPRLAKEIGEHLAISDEQEGTLACKIEQPGNDDDALLEEEEKERTSAHPEVEKLDDLRG